MNILRLSTVALTLAIAVFALGYVNPSFAHKTDEKHNHGGGGEEPPPPVGVCAVSPCIVSVGKSLRPAAADYVVNMGTYTVMSSQRFGEILGTSTAIAKLCLAVDVLIVDWSNPKIKNLTWPRLVEFMACGGGIIFEDPRNVEALAPEVSTQEINFHSTEDGPIQLTLEPVCKLTLGLPLNTIACLPLPGVFPLEVVNQHMTFDMLESDGGLMPFLELAVSMDVVGIYGKFGAGGIVVTGPDNNFHGNLIPIPSVSDEINAARANQHRLLHNEITWLLSL